MKERHRLDLLLVRLGLAESRARAQALILAGQVRVNDVPVVKAGTAVDAAARVTLAAPDHPYVGRGGLKLAHALDRFGLEVAGRAALDIGASTGGFTDVLHQRGADHIVALDVGRGQLAWTLRDAENITPVEGVNARYLTPDALPHDRRHFDLVTIDVSFISLTLVLPAVPPLLRAQGDVVALVKPQFEAGRAEVGKGGIVRDPAVQARVVDEVLGVAATLRLGHAATTPSPIRGAEGNQEFFVHLRHAAP